MNQGSVITIPQELEGVQHITHAVAGVEHTILFAGTAKSSSPLGVDWLGAYNQPGGYADLRFTTAAATATGDKTPFHAHRCTAPTRPFSVFARRRLMLTSAQACWPARPFSGD
jgi:hypothetical protein